MQTRELNYRDGTSSLTGLLVRDDQVGGMHPGIVVFPDARGIGEHAIDVARRLAMHGLVVLVADLYGNGTRARDMAHAMELMTHLRSDVTLWRSRAQAALDALSCEENVNRSRLATIGYCFGGTTALELARSGASVAGIVSFHGGLSSPKPDDAKNIRGKVLVCHGALDPLVPLAQVAAFEAQMSKTDVDWQVCVYGGAMHAFTNPAANLEGMAYHAAADRRSWKAMLALFEEIF
ncbi:MAG: dienelactone hydrolase family protein [Rhizomicrobium sp.]